MKKSHLLGLAIFAVSIAAAGAASAKDKYVECIDPDVGKSCMECNQGGTQVCCPKQGTCTVNKGGSDDYMGGSDLISGPTACSESESQEPTGPASDDGSEQQS